MKFSPETIQKIKEELQAVIDAGNYKYGAVKQALGQLVSEYEKRLAIIWSRQTDMLPL